MDLEFLGGASKAAVVLLKLNAKTARLLLDELDEDEIATLSNAMVNLGIVPSEIVQRAMMEFLHNVSGPSNLVGNIKSTEKFWRKFLDQNDAKLDYALQGMAPNLKGDLWAWLDSVDVGQIVEFIKNEHPQTAAAILSRLAPRLAALVIAKLEFEFASEILRRMLCLDRISPLIMQNLVKTLELEFGLTATDGTKPREHQDNAKVVASILDHMRKNDETSLLIMLEQHDLVAAERVRNLMFTHDDLAALDPQDIQMLLRNTDKRKLPLALLNSPENVKNTFFKSMSERMVKLLKEEIDLVRNSSAVAAVEEAEADLLAVAKNLVARGLITKKRKVI